MKQKFYFFMLLSWMFTTAIIAAPKATLTSSHVDAASLNQGSTNNVVYVVKMKVTVSAVTINNIQFTLSGTHSATDMSGVYVYYNAAAPVISGASYLGGTTTVFNAPHTYSISINRAMNVNDSGYFIISSNINATATDNKTIQINGATNPVVFGYSVATTVVNSQSNAAGIQTIQAADVTLTTNVVDTASLNQGSTNNIVYVVKMATKTEPVTASNISFNLNGTHDNNDLTGVYVYYNATAPVISGASYLGGTTTIFDAPHTYSIGIYKPMALNESGYYIIVANVSNTATDNHTIYINGATDPVQFSFATAPNITNSQGNKSKKQTIQAADITLTTNVVDSANLNQSSTNNIIYIAKMETKTEPVITNNISFTLSGSQDNNDLTGVYLYYNASAPVLSGASYLGGTTTIYDAPHTYSIGVYKPMALNESGYYIIVVNIAAAATDNHSTFINGAVDPVEFGFITVPNIVNSQTNKAKRQTIQAADITLTTNVVDTASLNQGSTNNIVYVVKMATKTEPVTASNISFNLNGTHDNNDLTGVYVYYNAAAPVISGASYLGGTTTIFDAPHTYSIGIYKPMALNESGYYIIVANVSNTATDNHTIYINGATDPVQFGFATAPNISNQQGNKAKKQTIQAPDVTLTSNTVAAGNILLGSTNNIVYTFKVAVKTEPVIVNNIQFELFGNHDFNDLTGVYLYYNASAPVISGASYLGGTTTLFDAPHTYSVGVYKPMVVNETGYYMIVVNVSSTANVGHTVKVNGATDPVVLGFATAPNVVNSQTNAAGTKTIASALNIAGNTSGDNEMSNAYTVNGIFPNPANTTFSFAMKGIKNETVKAQLTGRTGNVIVEKNYTISAIQNKYSMNVSNIPIGAYYLVLINDKGNLISKQQVNVQH